MKAKDLTLRVVNEIEKGKFEIKEFKPYMTYGSFVGCILADAEILRPTGLKDKNGKQIYEGDVLAADKICRCSSRYIIEWNDKHCCFTSIEGGIDNFIGDIDEEIQYSLLSNMKLNVCEIIGNIHVNPELVQFAIQKHHEGVSKLIKCEYCYGDVENRKQLLTDSFGEEIYIAGYNTLVGGDNLELDEIKINYCPMCGRKLGKELIDKVL